MIRASSIHRICTFKPEFDLKKHLEIEESIINTLQLYGIVFKLDDLKIYEKDKRFNLLIKTYIKSLSNKKEKENDELSNGAKKYLEDLWLELNYNFYEDSKFGTEPIACTKGILGEEEGIEIINKFYNLKCKKNEITITKDFITGTCDVFYINDKNKKVVRDNKSPVNWRSFKNIVELPECYYWQLIAYAYLYDAEELWVDFTLINTPLELREKFVRNNKLLFDKTEESISKLPIKYRIKSFEITNFQEDMDFMISRLEKSKFYYNSLNYEKCMKMK